MSQNDYSIISIISPNELSNLNIKIKGVSSLLKLREECGIDPIFNKGEFTVQNYEIVHYIPYDIYINQLKNLYPIYHEKFPQSNLRGFCQKHLMIGWGSISNFKNNFFNDFIYEDEFFIFFKKYEHNSYTVIGFEKITGYEIGDTMHYYETLLDKIQKFTSQLMFNNYKKEHEWNNKKIEDVQQVKTNNLESDGVRIDLSDVKGTEKIIMIEKLGILDYLKNKEPFNLSTNSLASAISGFTGIEAKTVQSYINPINNPNVQQKNNPLNSTKTVQKVNQKLISIGFKPHD